MVGEQIGDKVNILEQVTLDLGGTNFSQSAQAWVSTGSRSSDLTSGSLVIGDTMTGSIAEFRVWKNALSASKFKQHVLDKQSVVGNSLTGSRDELIYHYRLNENWNSGSSNPIIKDYNTGNLKNYSINISQGALAHTPLYDTDIVDRIQFSVGIGGAYELSDNNI